MLSLVRAAVSQQPAAPQHSNSVCVFCYMRVCSTGGACSARRAICVSHLLNRPQAAAAAAQRQRATQVSRERVLLLAL